MPAPTCPHCGYRDKFGQLRNPKAQAALPKKLERNQIVLMCYRCERIFAGYPAKTVEAMD